MSAITREEFEARVGTLEREPVRSAKVAPGFASDRALTEGEGEKVVTRTILEQVRRNGDDLAALKTRMGRVETRLDSLEQRFDGLDQKVDGLIRTLPRIVGDAVRDALRAERGS